MLAASASPKQANFPLDQFKWLTIVSPEEQDGTELLLKSNDHPAARTYEKAIYKQGLPMPAFAVDDIFGFYAWDGTE